MPSIEQYKMFVAVAEEQSLRAAAGKVYKTQPTVTSAIKKMEQKLNIVLFSRDDYRLKLTEQGQAIYKMAVGLLAKHQQVAEIAGHFNQGEESIINIAIEASFNLESIIKQLGYIQQNFAATEFLLQQEYMTGAIEKLLNGDVELAITPLNRQLFPIGEIETKPLAVGSFVNVASKALIDRHPKLNSVSELINEYQLIVKDTGTISGGKTFGVQQGQRAWYVNSFDAKKLLIRNGLGWGTMPNAQVRDLIDKEELVVLQLDDFLDIDHIEYYLVRLNNKVPGPNANKIWQLF